MSGAGLSIDKADELKAIIAPMLSLRPEDISDATPLNGLNTSLAGARLNIAVKRLGLELPKGPVPTNYGALVRLLTGVVARIPAPKSTPEQPGEATPVPGLPAGICGGIDVQQVSELPEAGDFWIHEWYSEMFSTGEIAWAVASAEPREHFAGFWCAKEALRKCDGRFRDLPPKSTFIAHEEDGRPFLRHGSQTSSTRLPHLVSISHSGPVATALVIHVPAPIPAEPTPVPAVPPAASGSGRVGLVIGLLLAIIIVFLAFRGQL